MPRPLVLYVTKVEDADNWFDILKGLGFKSIAKLHGKTERTDRERIVGLWKKGS